jgi:hypothetical protein
MEIFVVKNLAVLFKGLELLPVFTVYLFISIPFSDYKEITTILNCKPFNRVIPCQKGVLLSNNVRLKKCGDNWKLLY